MHGFNDSNPAPFHDPLDSRVWYKTLNSYQWFVLIVAALGWMLDCLDQQLFILARPSAMESLIADPAWRSWYGTLATFFFIIGWATGGLFFGVLGDRIGRARTMLITILVYSLFTGLSALSVTFADFAFYRFLTGLGVGGEFAAGVALVAEVMPQRARPYTLALLQALSAIGNVSAAFIYLGLGVLQKNDYLGAGTDESILGSVLSTRWRLMFVIGALPAVLVLLVRSRLKEPETWQRASREELVKKQLGSYRELLGTPELRRRALLGLVLGCSGIIGLWAVGFFTTDLIRVSRAGSMAQEVFAEKLAEAHAKGDHVQAGQLESLQGHQPESDSKEQKDLRKALKDEVDIRLSRLQSYTSIMQNLGAALGMFGFGALAQRLGRKRTFAIAFLAAFGSSVMVWVFVHELWQIFVMVPIMGFCQLSLFAGYAIYFPELFPTRLRSTGTSFCYNVGRYVAAFGLFAKGFFEHLFTGVTQEPFRSAGVALSGVFLIGLLALPFLPETKGKSLPE